MSYRSPAGSAPRPMNPPPMLSSRAAQPAAASSASSSAAMQPSASYDSANNPRGSPVLVRQQQQSSFESQPNNVPRPAPQPPSLTGSQGYNASNGESSQPSSHQTRPAPLSLEESKQVARTHHSALKRWLAQQEGGLNSASTRTNAREKLTRLTRQQFQELSTDVYDELMRRLQDSANGSHGQHGFLAVRPDFHPKRNQARQKLATLPITRFRDLGSDVYYELDRRYPEFSEEEETVEPLRSPGPSSAGQSFQQQQQQTRTSPQLSRDGSLASSHSHSLSGGQPTHQPQHMMRQGTSSPSPAPPTNLNAQRRAPTPTSTGNSSPAPANASLPPPVPLVGSTATPTSNDVVVPNKSTMRIEDPPRTGGSNSSSHMSPPPSATSSHFAPMASSPSPVPSVPAMSSAALARSGSATSNPYSQQQQYSPSPASRQYAPNSSSSSPNLHRGDAPQSLASGPGSAAGHGIPSPNFMNRGSETSSTGMMSRFVGAYGAGGSQYAASQAGASEAGRQSWDQTRASTSEQIEQVRASYEYKLTMLQNRINELENAAPSTDAQVDQVRQRGLEQQLEERERRIRALQDENTSLRSVQSTPATAAASAHSRSDSQFRSRLHEAEELASELRGEVSALVDEVRSANDRAEELQAELDRQREEKDKMQQEMTSWKERYQQVKVELRNIKATSQLFTSSISPDADFMPASADGLVSDTAVGSFQTSIDDLLQAARSKEPSNVFTAAHAVVKACEALDNDVQAIPPSRLAGFSPQDQENIAGLKVNINSTLSNLMTASKNHATSFGVLPVSLVDAAASHLAQAVVELVRVLKIRRTAGSGSSTPQRNGFGRSEPLPPMPENAAAQIAQRSDSLSQSQRGVQHSTSAPGQGSGNKPQGYFSGGLSTVKHALETFGLSSPTSTRSGDLPAQTATADLSASQTSAFSRSQPSYGSQPPASQSSEPYSPPQSQRQLDHSSFSTATSFSSPPNTFRSDEQYGTAAVPPLPARSDSHGHGEWRQEGQQLGGQSNQGQDFAQQQQQHEQNSYGNGAPHQPRYAHAPYAQPEGMPSPVIGGQERDPEELRAYVENQTEMIVHSIQSLLSAIRSGASSSELNDSLNQIITIVSSIVAISQQALPATDAEADAVLQDLTTHCDKLSEMQSAAAAQGGSGADSLAFTKQTKQAMAAASFGVAKSLKQLNGLLNESAASGGPDSLT